MVNSRAVHTEPLMQQYMSSAFLIMNSVHGLSEAIMDTNVWMYAGEKSASFSKKLRSYLVLKMQHLQNPLFLNSFSSLCYNRLIAIILISNRKYFLISFYPHVNIL